MKKFSYARPPFHKILTPHVKKKDIGVTFILKTLWN